MLIRDILVENKVNFTSQDLSWIADKDEFGMVEVAVLPNGDTNLGSGWDFPGGARQNLTFTLFPKIKTIKINRGSHGNKVLPRVQQALRSLYQSSIIDPSWKIQTQSDYAYYNNERKYTKHPSPIDNQGLETLVSKVVRLSPISKDLIFYHGTSEMDWKKIQKVGLHPLNTATNKLPGSESRGKSDMNDKVLYLASTVDKAIDYAKIRSAFWNRKLYGNEYSYSDDTIPVVLQVRIPDPSRLRADDDALIQIAQRISRRLWKSKSPEEQQEIINKINNENNLNLNSDTAQLYWREREGFSEIMKAFPMRAVYAWIASLKRNNQVGYYGFIPPKYISIFLRLENR